MTGVTSAAVTYLVRVPFRTLESCPRERTGCAGATATDPCSPPPLALRPPGAPPSPPNPKGTLPSKEGALGRR